MSNLESKALDIYDMYVMDKSGVPIFAGCTVSDFCMAHMDQHPLHTGFLTAMQSFGNEVFSGDLQNLTFPDIKIIIHTVTNYYFVYVFPKDEDEQLIKKMTDDAENKFRDKYEKNISSFKRSETQFQEFVADMIKIGLIPKDRLQSTMHYFVAEDEGSQASEDSVINRFRHKFRSLVKR